MTTMLEKAFRSLSVLPVEVQDALGQRLLTYAAQWRELKAGIDQATEELERGEGIEISSIDATVEQLSGKHGRS